MRLFPWSCESVLFSYPIAIFPYEPLRFPFQGSDHSDKQLVSVSSLPCSLWRGPFPISFYSMQRKKINQRSLKRDAHFWQMWRQKGKTGTRDGVRASLQSNKLYHISCDWRPAGGGGYSLDLGPFFPIFPPKFIVLSLDSIIGLPALGHKNSPAPGRDECLTSFNVFKKTLWRLGNTESKGDLVAL